MGIVPTPTVHANHLGYLLLQECHYAIAYMTPETGLTACPSTTYFNIDLVDLEHNTGGEFSWATIVADVYDASNGNFQGNVGFAASMAIVNSKAVRVNWWIGNGERSPQTYYPGSFANGWVSDGAGPNYCVDRSGILHLGGNLESGTLNTVAFTLPRPDPISAIRRARTRPSTKRLGPR